MVEGDALASHFPAYCQQTQVELRASETEISIKVSIHEFCSIRYCFLHKKIVTVALLLILFKLIH